MNDLTQGDKLDLRAELYCLLRPGVHEEIRRIWLQTRRCAPCSPHEESSILAFLVADLILENYKLERIKS